LCERERKGITKERYRKEVALCLLHRAKVKTWVPFPRPRIDNCGS